MIRLMKLVVSGICKVFLTLWFAVIAVRHHQIPMYIFFDNIFRYRKTVLTFADIFDDLCINTCLFLHFAKLVSQDIPPQPRQFPLAVPTLRTCSYNSCTEAGSYLEKSPHRRSSLLLSLQFLLSFGVPLRLVIGYHFFLQMTR